MEFEEYYNSVCEELAVKGYSKIPDRDIVEEHYLIGLSIDDCADGFVLDWGRP